MWENPKIAVGAKVAGLSIFSATALYALGKAVQWRQDRDVEGIGEGIREALGKNYSFPGKILIGGAWLYLAPALGMGHGALANFGLKERGFSLHTAGKVGIHALILIPTFIYLKG